MTESLDQDSLIEALRFSLTISKTEPLASVIVTRQDPAPDVISDADLANYIKTNLRTIHHPIGKWNKLMNLWPKLKYFDRYGCAGSESTRRGG
jgi:hypothetical protein